MATKRQPPTIRLRRLAAELRRLRAAAELTREVVAEKTGINGATLYRIENAQVRPQRRTLIGLLELYQVDGRQRTELLALLADAGQQSWLRPSPYDDLPDEFAIFLGLENEASSLSNYDPLLVPGQLQTEEYARAVIRGMMPMADAKLVERRVQVRMERKSLFDREQPLDLWGVVDEAAVRRLVGGPAVMRDQLQYLLQAMEQPYVTLQVVPFDAGAYAAMSNFVVMEFPGAEEPEVVYVESMAGNLFLEAESDIRYYAKLFDNLRAVALSPDQTASLIAEAAEQAT